MFFGSILFAFIFNRVKNKIFCTTIYTGIKLIKYKSEWHKQHDGFFDAFLDWVLL
jgi:hypothetical protein